MPITVTEVLMALGSWSLDLDYSHADKERLFRPDGNPRKLWALVYDSNDLLVYPPLPLLWGKPGKERIEIGGTSILWDLGLGGIGPIIDDREYLSGANKIDNPVFALDPPDSYWRRIAENSTWVIYPGQASNIGGLPADDTLEYDRKFPARPGQTFRALATIVGGGGRLRVRTIYEGSFYQPDLLTNGDFEDGPGVGWTAATNLAILPAGGRSGLYALWVNPIPKPQLVTGIDFSTGWTLGPTMSAHDQFLWIEETPKPQYLDRDSGDFTSSPFVTYETDSAHAFGAGTDYWAIGPIGQHMPVENPSFESGLDGWVEVAGAWSTSSATFVDGANSATTGGVAGGALKSLQADADFAGTPLAVDPFAWEVEEEWRFDVDICSGTKGTSDEADGEIHARVYLVDVNYPANDSHIEVVSLQGSALDAAEWHHGQQTYTVQADKVSFVPMVTIYGHENGSWYADNFRATRTKGNNTGIYSDDFAATPNQKYAFWAFVSSDDGIGGSITFRLIFKGTGLPDVETTASLSQTGGLWKTLRVEDACPKGYDTMVAAIDGDDITGGAFYVDGAYIFLEKVDNNTDRADGTSFAVVPAQKYLGGATIVRLTTIEKGTVRVGVVLSGPAVSDEIISEEHSFGEDTGGSARVTFDITPKEGYTTATPFVLAKDLSGGEGGDIVAVTNFTVEKSDNNSDSTTGDIFTVTPEREKRWVQAVRSGVNLQRGTVKLSVRCIRPDHEDVVFDSPAQEGTLGDWKFFDWTFTPPSGYEQVEPKIIATDVEGDTWQLDEGTIRDTDTGSVVFDVIAAESSPTSPFVDSTAPEGTETVRLAFVAEEGSAGRSVIMASLIRTDLPPSTGDDIIADLLVHPDTGNPVGIAPGTINCPEVIPFDWRQVKMTLLAALAHYVDVVSEPVREYRINPAIPPTIDVSSSPFVQRPIVLLPTDIDVEDVADPTVDVTNRATEIEVVGAEVQTLSGQTVLITATAAVPGEVEYDINGNPIVRTRPVSDATIDTFGYANAYAADQALREAFPGLVVDVVLTGTTTGLATARGPLNVGDWLEAYEPESGIQDLTNPKTVEGVPCFPRVMRTVTREREHGPSFRVEMLRPDGSSFPLPVNHSERDSTKLTLADRRLYEWEADPMGGEPGAQYLRDRLGKPR